MIVAGTNAADHTCLGFVTPDDPVQYYCPDRLASESALVLLVRGTPYETDGKTLTPAWLLGIQRADVTRVTVDQPPDWNQLDLPATYWGTWDLSLGHSNDAVVTVHLRNGRVRRAAVDLTRPGDRVIPIPG